MRFNTITINFSTIDEQDWFEEEMFDIGAVLFDKESDEYLWTTFDISDVNIKELELLLHKISKGD